MLNFEDQNPFRVASKQDPFPNHEVKVEKQTNDNYHDSFISGGTTGPSEDANSWTFYQRKAYEIVLEVQKMKNMLSSVASDERKVLNSLRGDDTGVAQKRKQVKRCKLFEMSAIVHLLNGYISSWNALSERRQTDLESNARYSRCSLSLAIALMNSQRKVMTELRSTLVRHLVQLVAHIDVVVQLGLRVMVAAGVESFSISLIQKAVVGVVAFNELVSLVEKCLNDENIINFVPKPISIKRMLTIMAEERSSKVAKLLFLILDDQMAKTGITSLMQSGEQLWSLGVATHTMSNSYRGHGQKRVTSDYGSDSCDCSIQNNAEEGCSMILPEALNTIQTMMAQEDLNIARLASVIHLTFMDVKQNRPSSSSTFSCHQQLQFWWTANDPYPSLASVKMAEQGISSLISNFYRDVLEIKVIEALKQHLECPGPGRIQNGYLLSTGLLLEIGNCALKLCHAEAQLLLLKSYRSLRSHLQVMAAIKAWDIEMCRALATTSDPKCLSPLLTTLDHGTKAGRCLVQSLEPIVWLELAVNHDPNLQVDLVHSVAFPRLLNTLQLIGSWLQRTTHYSLSSWQMVTFCLITQGDLKRIIDILKHMVNVNPVRGSSQECVTISGQSIVSVREALLRQMSLWEEINKAVAKIQNCSSNCMKDFCSACYAKIQKELESSMPHGKHWRQRCKRTGIPMESSSYARLLVNGILSPVIEGVCRLSTPTQISILSMATKVFCETWMNHILSKQIKFSLHGAHLLKLDFGYLMDFLNSQPMLSIETRQSVMSLEILCQFRGVSILLLQQTETPGLRMRRRKVAPFRGLDTEEPGETESGHRMESLDGGDSAASDTVPDEHYVQNKDQWLALRVHAAKSVNWPPFWCFS